MDKRNVLSVKNLNKIYKKKSSENIKALNNLNLDVKEGEIFGLLGPNGAGKTTFINILAGTVIKTSGEVNVWGFDLDKNPRQLRASLGIVPQEVNLDPFFSPKYTLELQAGLYGVKKKDRITNSILKMVSLEKQANSYARSLSGGMKRRLLIAKALVHQPPIIILDEPTAGVDVQLRKNLWNNVKLLNKQGVTVILTTHYIAEAEEMCDRIGIIDKGILVELDSTNNLLEKIHLKRIKIKINKKVKIDNEFPKIIKVLSNTEKEISLSYEKNSIKMSEIIQYLLKQNINIIDISTEDGNLEDIFIKLTKH
tara:strand:- start:1011 stop:1940 length:930 start_codon:yes stop_codon:yes gene_type:complete